MLDKAKGLDTGETYNNAAAGACFLEAVVAVEREKVVHIMDTIKLSSLTMDGSTDDGSVEQDTLFMRFCKRGKVDNRFIGIGEPESTSSSHLYNFVVSQLKTKNIYDSMYKWVGFGSDGALNMTGKKWVDCLAHSLERSLKDAIKKCSVYDRLATVLLGIYYFYKCTGSPLQRKTLINNFKQGRFKNWPLQSESYRELDVTDAIPEVEVPSIVVGPMYSRLNRSNLKIAFTFHKDLSTRVGGTKWLAHTQRAINNVLTENDNDSQEINNCVRKIDEMLSRRHNTATLTRDLRLEEDKEKWAEEYRKTALKPIGKEEIKNGRGGDVQKLKNEMDQIKRKSQREEETEPSKLRREMEELENSIRDNRSNRNNRGRRRHFDY
ncbi:unnamed protein product [Mytilus coruscus]|uniref:Uncharacterized protein n=1 Tax=Mytilus coruscus TaxID=42192 RepID=A0A6J8ENN7_MYTCO|nr:unnamed protein product [Mytilus coruscus]